MKTSVALCLMISALAAHASGAEPPALAVTSWFVTSIGGAPPLESHAVTFSFDAEGAIAGNASCNQFGGPARAEIGGSFSCGPLRSTMRACEEEVMKQERKFLSLLEACKSWELRSDGALILTSPDGTIEALPVEQACSS